MLTGLLLAGAAAVGQEAPRTPHVPLQKTIGQPTPSGPTPSLAVLNAAGAAMDDGRLTLTGVAANAIVFADRPVRAAGHVTTAQFIRQWGEGDDSFAQDPPNATVSVLGGNGSGVSDAVVTLTAPRLEGDDLTFDVTVLEGDLDGATGPAAVFIDHFAGGFHGGDLHGGNDVHVNNVNVNHWGAGDWRGPINNSAWYTAGAVAAGAAAGAAIGAAAAAPYAPYAPYPPCGYYPYPACY